MTKEKDSEAEVTYFGKKRYKLNPLLAKKKPTPEKTPNYRDNESGYSRSQHQDK